MLEGNNHLKAGVNLLRNLMKLGLFCLFLVAGLLMLGACSSLPETQKQKSVTLPIYLQDISIVNVENDRLKVNQLVLITS